MQSRDSLAQYGPNALEQERECFGDGRQVLQGPIPDFVTHGPSLGIEERRFLAWFVWFRGLRPLPVAVQLAGAAVRSWENSSRVWAAGARSLTGAAMGGL